jgi:hypothetical protein
MDPTVEKGVGDEEELSGQGTVVDTATEGMIGTNGGAGREDTDVEQDSSAMEENEETDTGGIIGAAMGPKNAVHVVDESRSESVRVEVTKMAGDGCEEGDRQGTKPEAGLGRSKVSRIRYYIRRKGWFN